MTGEIWEDIKGYEHLYQISNLGRVKSKAKHAGRSTRPERILKQSIDKDGYFRVSLCQNGKVRFLGVHRLMAEAFIPNPNHLPQVNHKNENKADNNLSNLE